MKRQFRPMSRSTGVCQVMPRMWRQRGLIVWHVEPQQAGAARTYGRQAAAERRPSGDTSRPGPSRSAPSGRLAPVARLHIDAAHLAGTDIEVLLDDMAARGDSIAGQAERVGLPHDLTAISRVAGRQTVAEDDVGRNEPRPPCPA